METSERNIEANMNELIGRIEAKYEKMSKGQKRLAEYVKENYDKAVFLTAARLGEIVGVSDLRLYDLQPSWDIGDTRNFRKRWRNLSVIN